MTRSRALIAGLSVTLCAAGFTRALMGENKRAIEPSDCVQVRYLKQDPLFRSIQINPQGTRVAYLVKTPNLSENRNDISLYVKTLPGHAADMGKLLTKSAGISHVQWLRDGRHLIFLLAGAAHSELVVQDVENGSRTALLRSEAQIREYTIDGDARTIVYTTEDKQQQGNNRYSPSEIARGYRVDFRPSTSSTLLRRRIWLVRRISNTAWSLPEPVTIRSLFSGQSLLAIPYSTGLRVSLSPDGKHLALTYIELGSQVPAEWRSSPQVTTELNAIDMVSLLLIKNLADKSEQMPLATPWALSVPLWSSDSRNLIVVAQSPVGSASEREDIQRHRGPFSSYHLFFVGDHRVERIPAPVARIVEQPLSWSPNGTLIVRTSNRSIATFSRDGGGWKEVKSFTLPPAGDLSYSEMASDGRYVIGDIQGYTTPPELFLYRPNHGGLEVFERLNPQFDNMEIAPVEKISWQMQDGFRIDGILVKPPDYDSKIRYPLVIQTKPVYGQFLCDTGQDHFPSFAPQPLADAGILYLARIEGSGYRRESDQAHYPKGYPGHIDEAAFQMEIWDTAVDALTESGMIDPSKVGIIGFSRSGWYTEFSLAHGRTHYAAATATDNIQYSLGEYWLLHSNLTLRPYDVMYGGPPYGDTLQNWLDYSISFNLTKMHTPLLMEEMGYGVPYTSIFAPPLHLAIPYEIFVGLTRLRKPVELYYYPDEDHQPDHPKARLASLQRNVDWYRFWLQGYERPHPSDIDQYVRWRSMRALQKSAK